MYRTDQEHTSAVHCMFHELQLPCATALHKLDSSSQAGSLNLWSSPEPHILIDKYACLMSISEKKNSGWSFTYSTKYFYCGAQLVNC